MGTLKRKSSGCNKSISFRSQGAPPNRKAIAWQPTHQPTFHVPEAFGVLKLVD